MPIQILLQARDFWRKCQKNVSVTEGVDKGAICHPFYLISDIVKQWKGLADPGILMDKSKYINALPFAD
jgi:hypothetical protein